MTTGANFAYGYVPPRVYHDEYTGQDIISYGRTNTYPQEVDYAVSRNGTATSCLKVFSEFLYGNGFADDKGAVVVNAKGETLNEVLARACYDFAQYGGFSLWLNVDLNGDYTSIEHQPFTYVRLGIPDDRRNITQAHVSDNWAGESWRNDANTFDAVVVDLFNPDKILDQVALLEGESEYEQIEEYKGQLMYFTLNGGFYGKSFFDSVIEQILSSGDLAEFDRRYIQNGFAGSVVISNKTVSVSDNEFEQRKEQYQQLGGVQKAGGIFYIEGDIQTIDLAGGGVSLTERYNSVKEGNKDDIIEALGIPQILVSRSRQGGGFPNQDEIINSFQFYNGNTKMYRDMIAKQFNKIAEHFAGGIIDTDLEIEAKGFEGVKQEKDNYYE